ncbi:MAG: hypothetical protein HY935_07385 [Nitrosomonadales bacterium]|nr:hypothetical protein [Nitrosomonadales bacterium]
MFAYSNWSVLTVSFVVVLSLALSGVTLCSVLHLVNAKWRFEVRHLAASLFALFPLAFVLLIILLVGGANTFHWWAHMDTHGAHMPGWYHPTWLISREIVGMVFMIGLYWEFVQRQAVSDNSPEDAERFHHIATWIPFFFVLYSTMIAWDFEMTLVPHWHSAIYGMHQFISNFGMFLAFLVVWIYVLNSRQKLVRPVPDYIYNYLAQMLLSFSLLWIYTFDAQYLTIWYGNLPDETDRLFAMQNGDYAFIWWATLALKFVIPFVAFCFPGPRHNVSAINAVAVCIIVGTLFERYVWIGGIEGTGAYPYLASVAVGSVVAIIGFFLVRMQMRRSKLIKG